MYTVSVGISTQLHRAVHSRAFITHLNTLVSRTSKSSKKGVSHFFKLMIWRKYGLLICLLVMI